MFKFEFLNFYIFNVADVLLTVSCFLFIIYLLFGYKGDERDEDEDEDEDEDADYYSSDEDDDIEQAEIESTDVEEEEPAKPIEIDNAFWGTDKEPVRNKPEKAAKFTPPAPKAEPIPEPEAAPVEETFDVNSIFENAEAGSSVFDDFSLDSILDEFK